MLHTVVYFGHVVFSKRNIGAIHVGKELQGLSADGYGVDLDAPYRNFLSSNVVQVFSDVLSDIHRKLLCTSCLWKEGSGEESKPDILFCLHSGLELS